MDVDMPTATEPVHTGVQTDISGRDGVYQLFSINRLDTEAIHHYTGLSCRSKFDMVLSSLGPARFNLEYYYSTNPPISINDQFLLTLIKLRTHPPNVELAINFGINQKQVSNIFITWINFMYFQWKEVNWWPDQQTVKFYSPSGFKASFPNTRILLDGTECPVQKPSRPTAQQSTFSTYKNRNTIKVIVGATPGGLVSYVSDAYGGSASDRQIVERSDLQSQVDWGDELMVDKGFICDDLFIPLGVTINIPTFFKKKNRMSGDTVRNDRKIASKRVHIERIIGLAKTYKILTQPMCPLETSLATQIVTVCFYLCNFRKCIVSKTA